MNLQGLVVSNIFQSIFICFRTNVLTGFLCGQSCFSVGMFVLFITYFTVKNYNAGKLRKNVASYFIMTRFQPQLLRFIWVYLPFRLRFDLSSNRVLFCVELAFRLRSICVGATTYPLPGRWNSRTISFTFNLLYFQFNLSTTKLFKTRRVDRILVRSNHRWEL